MRRLLAIAAFLLISSAVHASPLEGAWQLVSGQLTKEGKTTAYPKVRMTKILAGSHFAFVTVGEDGKFVRAATGTFTLRGDQYAETVEESSGSPKPGVYTFTSHIKGDEWTTDGAVGPVTIHEVWRRMP